MKKIIILLSCLSLLPAYAAKKTQSPKYHPQNLPVLTGAEEYHGLVAYPPYPELPGLDEVDLIGDTLTLGMTWYENQHNGTIGRMVEKSSDGYLHFVWMKGYQAGSSDRHVWYNAVDLATGAKVFLNGTPVDASSRAGFTTLDAAYGGCAFPAFHQVTNDPSGNPHTAVAFDLIPHIGAFTPIEPEWLYDPYGAPRQIIWPKMQMDRQQRMQILSTEQVSNAGDPQRQYYTPGVYDPLSYTINYPTAPDSAYRMISWTMTIAGEVATSEVSDRVAFGWTYPLAEGFPGVETSQLDNDIWIMIDEDGANPNFSQAFNLTNFIPPDLSLLPDTLAAMKDTLRAYTDMNLFFDQDDWLHAVFTTPYYNSIDSSSSWHSSIVWHWSEQYPNDFQMIHNAFDDAAWNNVYCGAWNVKAQRPSLGQDLGTGYLYCMYQVYDCDTLHLSHFIGPSGWGMPSGEVYVSVSTDGGLNWSVGTNVTNTITPTNAPAGQCKSELTPSLAKEVDGFCRIMYVYDLDAGNCIQSEGSATNNPVRYHKVPVNLIPTTPLVPQWPTPGGVPFHVEPGTFPNVNINLTTYGGSIVIPPGGGAFNFNISAHNNTPSAQTFDAWCMVSLPNGQSYGPVLGPFPLTLAGGATIARDRTQYVPAGAPSGSYTYLGNVGDYPATIWDQDSFPFTKLPGDNGSIIGDWANVGQAFTGELATAPSSFALLPCSPNPFNPETAIRFELPVSCLVRMQVYDLAGRMVSELVNGWREAGSHEVLFDGSDLASGIYIYRLQAGAFAASGKLILLK